MALSRSCFLLFLFSLLSLSALASEENILREVINSDGTVARYRLLPVHHDPSHAAVVQERLNSSLETMAGPSKYEIPHKLLPPVRDQGMRGTCAYFATLGLLESYYMAKSPKTPVRLSEECLVDVRNWMADESSYKGADKPEVRPDPNGDLPTSIIKTIVKNGVPFARKYSTAVNCVYDGSNQVGTDLNLANYLETFTKGAHPSKTYGKAVKFNENTKPTVAAIRALIAKNIPVEVGILVYNEFMEGGSSDWRFDPKVDTADQIAGGHAIILTGYKTTAKGTTIFTFKNSWNTSWGKAGFGTINAALLANSWGYDPTFDFIVSVHP